MLSGVSPYETMPSFLPSLLPSFQYTTNTWAIASSKTLPVLIEKVGACIAKRVPLLSGHYLGSGQPGGRV